MNKRLRTPSDVCEKASAVIKTTNMSSLNHMTWICIRILAENVAANTVKRFELKQRIAALEKLLNVEVK